ncbi:MAG: glycosyltransferase family 39 protein [Campylobacter sp.]
MKELICRHKTIALTAICALDLLLLLYCASTLSISYQEARVFFGDGSVIGYVARASCALFGQNDFALRAPAMLFHLISVILLYKISKFYLKFELDRLLCVLLFIVLPGALASALTVNNAGLCVMLALLSIYFFHERSKLFYPLFVSLFFVNGDFLIFYAAFFIYAIYRKNAPLAWISALLLTATFGVFGFDTKGRPSGHFIDTFGIFAAVFSPFVFIFFVYTIYRIWIKEQKELLWFVCVSSFCFCMLVSVRQRLELEVFLPFCIIATPLMIRTFFGSYRVRLPKFRRAHKAISAAILVFLCLNWLFLAFNQILYPFLNEPQKHFAYKFHVAKELASELKRLGEDKIYVGNEKLALRLKFYDIDIGKNFDTILIEKNLRDDARIRIKILDAVVAVFDLRKKEIYE